MNMHIRVVAVAFELLSYCTFASADEAAIARCSVTGVVAVGRGPTTEKASVAAATSCYLKKGLPVCCQPVIDTNAGDCIALAVGELGGGKVTVGTGAGGTRQEAKDDAFADCGADVCEVLASVCKN
jgi:hypothetical protein